MVEFTPIIPVIRNTKGKVLYGEMNKPFAIKLWKSNYDRVPFLIRRFEVKNRNALINHLIEMADMLYEVEKDLKERGSFNLTAETAKRFGIKL